MFSHTSLSWYYWGVWLLMLFTHLHLISTTLTSEPLSQAHTYICLSLTICMGSCSQAKASSVESHVLPGAQTPWKLHSNLQHKGDVLLDMIFPALDSMGQLWMGQPRLQVQALKVRKEYTRAMLECLQVFLGTIFHSPYGKAALPIYHSPRFCC